MTYGEKLVWAAVFASNYMKIKNPPPHLLTSSQIDNWAGWERGIVNSAIEDASFAVDYLRESAQEILDGYGGSSKAYQRLMEVLREDNKPQ
jgi:hypothetical protein